MAPTMAPTAPKAALPPPPESNEPALSLESFEVAAGRSHLVVDWRRDPPTTPVGRGPSQARLQSLSESRNGLIRKPRKGASRLSSVFNLANTIMGSGLLTLPSAFATSGLAVGLFMAVAAAGLNVLTLHQLSYAATMRRVPPRASIGEVAEAALPHWGGLIIDLVVSAYSFGVCIGYLIVATDSLVEITGSAERHGWTLLALLLVAPLTLLRTMDSLKFTSIFAVLALLAVAVVILVFAGSAELDACAGFTAHTVGCHGDPAETRACPGGVRQGPAHPSGVVRALSKFVLAYGCQQNILPIVGELHQPSTARVLSVELCAIVLALVVYAAVATAGYLTFGGAVCGNILNSYPRDTAVNASRLMIAGVVVTSYPLLAFEAKRAMLLRLRACRRRFQRARAVDVGGGGREGGGAGGGGDGGRGAANGGGDGGSAHRHSGSSSSGGAEDGRRPPSGLARVCRVPSCFITSRDELLVAMGFLGLTGTVALSVSDLGAVLEFVGASAGVVIAFVVPSACYASLAPHWGVARGVALLTLVFGLVLLPLAIAVEFMPEEGR